MEKSSKIQNKSSKTNMLINATSVLALSIAATMSSLPSLAHAQDATKDTQKVKTDETANKDEVVLVVGIRKSLRKAISIKRVNQSVVEVATAEDIGKLPGVSIAETLSRLPGVAAQRVDGRAQVISIRGMAPAYSVTLLNGMEMVSTGDDRSFEYDQFPAELVTQAMVYKTPDAALGSQGLSGTVDLATISPLLLATEKKFNVSARAELNSNDKLIPGTKNTGSRFTASYIDKNEDGTFGVALGYTRLDSPTLKKYFNPWDFGPAGWWPVVGVPEDQLVYDGFETGVMAWDGVRDSMMGVLEFKPTDNFKSKLNIFHSQFKQDMNGREFAAVIGDWGLGNVSSNVTSNNGADGLTVENVAAAVTMRKDHREDKVDAITWSNEFNLIGWDFRGELGYSKATRKQDTYEVYAATKEPITITAAINPGFDNFGQVTSSFDFGNIANYNYASYWWGGGAGYIQNAVINDEMKNARLSAKHEFRVGFFKDFETGLIYSDRLKKVNYVGTSMLLANPVQEGCIHYYDWDSGSGCAVIPSNIVQSSVSVGFAGIPSMISFDAADALSGSEFIANTVQDKNQNWNWEVNEKITTFFMKFGLEFDAGIPFTGNFGLQAVHADQSSTGTNDDGTGSQSIISIGTSYTDYLPSLNLTGDLGNGLYLKLAAAQVTARPPMQYMRANFSASVDPTTRLWSGSGGNPKLEPWRANAYDISLEKYFSKGTYLAVAAFKKDLTSGIYEQTIAYDFTGFNNPTSVIPISSIGLLTAPANVKSGYIKGYEISGALELANISKKLDGFGLIGSFSDTSSDVHGTNIYGVETTQPLEGLSGKVASLSVYYENNGWQFRIGDRYRSEYSAIRHNSFKNVIDTIRPENLVELQAGYTFQSGPLQDLNILFQINNLTDAAYVTSQTVEGVEALKEYHKFGRQYLLGLSYKF
jgi:iron complex outermembrane receptor protein